MSDMRQSALSGMRWSFSSRIALQLLSWPATIVVMRLLDASDYGLFAAALLVSGFVSLFAELGLGVALVQVDRVDLRAARTASGLIVALNTLLALTIVALAPSIAGVLDKEDAEPVMQVLTVELLVTAWAVVPQALLERNLQFRQLSMAHLAGGAVAIATALTGALMDAGVWALVASNLANATTRALLVVIFNQGPVWPSWPHVPSILPMLHMSGHAIAGRSLWYWYGQADQLVLARLLQAAAFGVYSVSSQLAMLPAGKVMEIVNRVALPILSQMRTDAAGMVRAHERLIGLLALYGFGVCWGLAVVVEDFVAVVLGAKWAMVAVPLAALSLVAPLRMICSLHNTITTAVGKPRAATNELMFASVFIPAVVCTGGWMHGVTGAALGWAFAYPFVWLISNALTCRALGTPAANGMRPLAAPLASGVAMVACVYAIRLLLAETSASARLAVTIVAGAGAYLGTFCIIGRGELRDAVGLARELFRPKQSAPATSATSGSVERV